MADLAVVFGWRPADMDPMGTDELMRWHAKATARHPGGDRDDG